MELNFVCAFFFGFLTAIYFFFKIRFSCWSKRNVPYLNPSIPYGNLKNVGKSKHILQVFGEIYGKFKNSAPFCGAYFTISPVVVVTNLDLVRDILIKDFNFFHDRFLYYNERDDPLSAHLVAIEGEKWRRLRMKLTPTFTSAKIKQMFPTVLDITGKLLMKITEDMKSNRVIEMKDLLERYTMDIIGTVGFGIECKSLSDSSSEFHRIGREFFEKSRYSRLVQEIINQYPKLFVKFGFKKLRDDVSEFFMRIVKETVAYREKNNVHRNDFMDLLIDLKNHDGRSDKLTIEEIAAQAFAFFLGSFETSATLMAYTLYQMALNPIVQIKARNEIDKVLTKYNGHLSYDAVMDMKYIQQILEESMRMCPVGPALMRKCTEKYPVRNTNQTIEKGLSVFIPIYAIHHDPDIYPNPFVYDPERFASDEKKARHPMSFLGFGNGPRNCIGMRFGQMQTRLGLISLLRNFQFSTCKQTIIAWKFAIDRPLLSPKGGLYLYLEKN